MLSFTNLKEAQSVLWTANGQGVTATVLALGIEVRVGSSGEARQVP